MDKPNKPPKKNIHKFGGSTNLYGESPRDQIFGPPQGAGPETTTGHPAARAGELDESE